VVITAEKSFMLSVPGGQKLDRPLRHSKGQDPTGRRRLGGETESRDPKNLSDVADRRRLQGLDPRLRRRLQPQEHFPLRTGRCSIGGSFERRLQCRQ